MKRSLGIVAIAAVTGMFAAGAVQSVFSAWAIQNELVPPTSGIYTGPQFSQKIGDAFKSVASGNKGATAPANVEGATVDGLRWIDDTTSLWLKKTYVNGGWATEGAYNAADSSWVGIIGGGAPASLASGATVDLGSVPQANVTITGATTITGFGASAPAGIVKIIRFDGVLKLTNSSAIAIPCGFDLMTAAGDRAIVTHLGDGGWEITQYTRASGIPLDCSAVGKVDFTFAGAVPPLHVAGYGQALTRAYYPAYLAKVTRSQNGSRVTGNATITGIADTSGFGPGMPVEGAGINAGCTLASYVANSSITLNSSSCVTTSGTATVTVFLTGYGAGGDATTVGVSDCRGRVMAGRDRFENGAWANRLTTSYFGSASDVMNAANGFESQTLTAAQLPSITSTNPAQPISVVTTVGGIPFNTANSGNTGSGGSSNGPYFPGSIWIGTVTSAGNNSISVTSTGTNGNSHRVVQPTLIAECVVRVTP